VHVGLSDRQYDGQKKKDRQYNGQKKKQNKENQWSTILRKLKIEQQEPE
jgi:hypothetical protein